MIEPIPPKVEGKITATMERLIKHMAEGPITVSDRRRWTRRPGLTSGPIAWAAARRLVNNGRAFVVRKTIATITRGPKQDRRQIAHELTIVRKEPDVI